MRIAELRHVERVLAGTLGQCCKGGDPDICAEIHRLGGVACKPVKRNSARRA